MCFAQSLVPRHAPGCAFFDELEEDVARLEDAGWALP